MYTMIGSVQLVPANWNCMDTHYLLSNRWTLYLWWGAEKLRPSATFPFFDHAHNLHTIAIVLIHPSTIIYAFRQNIKYVRYSKWLHIRNSKSTKILHASPRVWKMLILADDFPIHVTLQYYRDSMSSTKDQGGRVGTSLQAGQCGRWRNYGELFSHKGLCQMIDRSVRWRRPGDSWLMTESARIKASTITKCRRLWGARMMTGASVSWRKP